MSYLAWLFSEVSWKYAGQLERRNEALFVQYYCLMYSNPPKVEPKPKERKQWKGQDSPSKAGVLSGTHPVCEL